jgi:long-chain acyl-CoA synthetase
MNDYPWLKQYPKGIPAEINPNKYNSLIELCEGSFIKFSSLTAYENMGVSLTYKDVETLSEHFAAYLQNVAGLKKGDRIAIQMPNLLQYPIAMFGAIRAGLVVVNTNPLYTAREMEHQFKDSGATAVVILANFASNLEKILDKTQIKTVIVTEIGDMLGTIKGGIVNFVVKHFKKMVPSYSLPNAISFKDVLKQGKLERYNKPEVKQNEVAFLQYTGGTTGVSKGAMLTHKNIIANMEQISAWMVPKLKESEEVVITALPLYHIFALTVNGLAMLKIGAKNILITNPRDMPAFIKELRKYPFTVITGVNTLFNGLLNQEDFKKLDFSHLKIAVGGGMAVQKVVAHKWKEVTGTSLAEGYGLTETSPVLTCNPIDGTERIGSIGVPLPNTEVTILDEEGNPVKEGEAGEICAKGPQIMPGYYQRPDETEKVFLNGWFKTGDIGIMEPDGYFRIVDRKKDMILVSGFNVYPNEIEDVIAAHPKVLEVAAVGVPDEKSTEAVKVFVVKKDESLTEDELKTYCKENLTNYKVPKLVEFRTELPKTNVGKILRRLLKEEGDKTSTVNQ